MKFYCGIDLSARDCHVCVIDEQLKVMVQQKLRNELPKIVQLLEPYKANLKTVVESTFNWYWLIDGLQVLEAVRKTTSQPDDSTDGLAGHYCVVFSIDRPPLLA